MPNDAAQTPSTPAPSTPESFITANGVRLCYQRFGDPAAPAILLIMGLGAQMILWSENFCDRLVDGGFQVVRFDNRDIGRSDHLDHLGPADVMAMMMAQMRGEAMSAPYLLRDMAADAAALLQGLGIAQAHLVGASMGGMIAQEFALNHGEVALSLTSIMSSTGRPGLPGPKPEAAALLMRPAVTERAAYIAQFCETWRLLRAGSFPEDEARDPLIAARLFDRGLSIQGTGRQLAAILASGNREPRLAGLYLPTLVVHGVPDPLVPVEAGRATAAAIPGSRLLEFDDMGHAIPAHLVPAITSSIVAHAKGQGG